MGSRHRTRGATKASCASVPAPTISLERLRANDRGVLRALRDALVVAPGFFNLDASNALPPALVRECYEVARAFFALPLDAKAAYVHTQYDRETGGCAAFERRRRRRRRRASERARVFHFIPVVIVLFIN
jgi:isopenicillin N synthase-like dioxygenase